MGNEAKQNAKCHSCGNNAILQTKEGLLLCADCYFKISQAKFYENIQLMVQVNQLMDQMSYATGLDVPMPKYKIPLPEIKSTNFQITDSVIGTINNGYAMEIINNMANIKSQGDNELYTKMTEFFEALKNETKMTKDLKEELLERWAFINSQMSIKPELRKKGMIKEAIEKIRISVDDYVRVKEIFVLLYPLLTKLFG